NETESSTPDDDQYEILFPLPEIDPSMCRDEFIKKFVQDEEARISALKPRVTDTPRLMSQLEEQMKWGPENYPPESRLLASIIRKWFEYSKANKASSRLTRSSTRASTWAAQYLNLNKQCQKASIEFMSVRLIRQLRLFSSPWPGNLDDMPYRLFSWSLDNFIHRLDHNQMYLDVIHRERTTEDLDCLKFRTDLHEIMLLIYEIREDFSFDINLCENSMAMLRYVVIFYKDSLPSFVNNVYYLPFSEANYNMNGPWIQGLADNRQIRDKLKASLRLDTSSSANIKITRLTEVLDQVEDVSATDPIELRYRFNWLNSCADQRLMRLNQREVELEKQLKDLEEIIYKDELVQNQSENIYSLQVDNLRDKLNEWQSRFENDLENAEVECTVARLAQQKVVDDYKFYSDLAEMYKRRIAEEREIMATEEKIRQEKQVG
ncbi:hypothetical protein KR032_011812, partial [Drosophila birchii]